MKKGWVRAAKEAQVRIKISGLDSIPSFSFDYQNGVELLTFFIQEKVLETQEMILGMLELWNGLCLPLLLTITLPKSQKLNIEMTFGTKNILNFTTMKVLLADRTALPARMMNTMKIFTCPTLHIIPFS